MRKNEKLMRIKMMRIKFAQDIEKARKVLSAINDAEKKAREREKARESREGGKK